MIVWTLSGLATAFGLGGCVIRTSRQARLSVVAVALVVISPAVIIPGALNRFVFGKLALAAVGIGIGALAGPTGRVRRGVAICLGLGAAVIVTSALAGPRPVVGLLGRAPRYEGIFVLACYLGSAWVAARQLGPNSDRRVVASAARALTLLAFLVALIAVLEACGLRPLSTDVSRPGSLLGNASDEGTIGVLVLGPLALLAIRDRDKLYALGAVSAGVTTVLSASRGALLAMLVELAAIGVVLGGRRVRVGVVAAIVAVTGLSLALSATRDRILGTSPLARHTATGRELLWRETLDLDASHLGLGVGPSSYRSSIVAEHDRQWQTEVGPQDPPDSPHSFPLQALSVGGLPLLGLLIFLAWQVFYLGGREALARRSELPFATGALISLGGYGIAGLVGVTSPGPTLLACVFVGALCSEAAPLGKRSRTSTAVAVGAFGLAGVFLLAGLAEIPMRHAVVALSKGDVVDAGHDFDAARVLRPWDLDLPDVAGHAFVTFAISTGDEASTSQAATWLSRVPGELHDDEQVSLDSASLDEARRDYPAAEELLTAVLRQDRSNPAVLLQRGIVEAEAGSDPLAERDFRAATSIVPDDPGPWTDLAALYQQEGRAADAAAASAEAQRLARDE